MSADNGGHKRELSDQVLGISKVSGFLEWLSLHPIVTEADDPGSTDVNASSHKMIIFAHHLKVLDKLQVRSASFSQLLSQQFKLYLVHSSQPLWKL